MEFSSILNLIFIVAYLIVVIFLIKRSLSFIFLFGLILFQSLTILPSLFYIESGIFINEQGRQSFFAGATILTVFYYLVTFFVLIITFKTLNRYSLRVITFTYQKKALDESFIKVFIVIVLGLLYLNAFLSPLPFFNDSISRFTYWGNSKFPFLNGFFGDTAMFIPFALGYLFSKQKKFSIFFFLLYIVYNFLIGQKFSPILNGSFSFLLPIILTSTHKIKSIIFKNIIWIFFLISIGSFVIYQVIYNKYENTKPFANAKIYDPNEAIFYRIFGLQGHLLWGATERYVANDEQPKTYNPLNLVYGMQVMMEDFADNKDVLKSNEELGYNFTNAYPAILLSIFPLSLALVFHSLFTIVFLGFVGWVLKEFITKKAGILSVIIFQLFMWTIYAFTMGYFYKLFFISAFIIFYFAFLKLSKKVKLSND
jgi:hypothetical protein